MTENNTMTDEENLRLVNEYNEVVKMLETIPEEN